MKRLFVLTAVTASLVLSAGCKPKAGDKCKDGQMACTDATNALACGKDSTLVAVSCKGPQGCAGADQSVACDNSLAQPADGCTEEGDVACATDKKAALECKGGKFVVGETCKGARACDVHDSKIACDNDVADVGDPCHFLGDYACTPDKQLALKCVGNVFTALNACRGTDACKVVELPEEKKVDFVCDDSVAQENDACDTESEEACSVDKKHLLACKANKFVDLKPCAGPLGCHFDAKGEHFMCDHGGASVAGEPAASPTPAPAGGKGGASPSARKPH